MVCAHAPQDPPCCPNLAAANLAPRGRNRNRRSACTSARPCSHKPANARRNALQEEEAEKRTAEAERLAHERRLAELQRQLEKKKKEEARCAPGAAWFCKCSAAAGAPWSVPAAAGECSAYSRRPLPHSCCPHCCALAHNIVNACARFLVPPCTATRCRPHPFHRPLPPSPLSQTPPHSSLTPNNHHTPSHHSRRLEEAARKKEQAKILGKGRPKLSFSFG